MKQRLILFLLSLALAPLGHGAQALFQVNSPTNNPVFDAVVFVNGSSVTVSKTSLYYAGPSTTIYTNLSTGTFTGFPGYNFGATNLPADRFVNLGSIVPSGPGVSPGPGGQLATGRQGGVVNIYATNVLQGGTVDVGADGAISISGRSINTSRGILYAGGDNPYPGSQNLFFQSTDYLNATGVRDNYWAAGIGQHLQGQPQGLQVDNNPFPLPNPQSPVHDVLQVFGRFSTIVPTTFGTAFNAAVFNSGFGTNQFVTIVYYAVNPNDTGYSTSVRFVNSGQDVVPLVEFSLPETDPVSGRSFNNLLYFIDRTQQLTNINYSSNVGIPGNFRPTAYEITRATPSLWFSAQGANGSLTPSTFYQNGFSNRVVTNVYYGYSANIGDPASVPVNANNSDLDDPTKFGRIDINANDLDISRARLRAEALLNITVTNSLISTNAGIDAPIINYNLTSTNIPVTLTNLIPASVKRFNGPISAWTGLWTNLFGALQIQYHVIILDASRLRSVQTVTTPIINIKSTNVLVDNILSPTKVLRIDSPSLTFGANNFLMLTNPSLPNLVSSNLPNLNYFTNLGTINIGVFPAYGEGHFASANQRATPFKVMVNRGFINGSTIDMRAEQFNNSGIIFGQNGPVTLEATFAKLQDGWFQSVGNITLKGGDYKIRGSTNVTFTTLNLIVTNSLTDIGSDASNIFYCGFGFNLPIKPTTGDLLGTTLTSEALTPTAVIPHTWAGEDRGASRLGYTDNCALGRLVLRATSINNQFVFTGTGAHNGLYVDFLELDGVVSNNIASVLSIDPSLTIYFANANVSIPSLDGALGGRLKWVKGYVGAGSSVDVVLPSGQTVQVNVGLLTSTTIDSDNDGIVNAFDTSPFDGVVLNNTVTFTNVPPLKASISWEAAADTVYTIEYATTLAPPQDWTFLQSYTNSATVNGTVTIQDTVPVGNKQRYYRVLYTPGL